MILEMCQSGVEPDTKWEINEGIETICNINPEYSYEKYLSEYTIKDLGYYRLYCDVKDMSYGSTIQDRFSFKIYKNNKYIGWVINKNKNEVGLYSSYPYIHMQINNKTFCLYEVNFKNDLYLCIYKENKLITMVKGYKQEDNNMHYTIYAESRKYIDIAIIFVLYYDATYFKTYIGYGSNGNIYRYTIKKELLDKYDPNFINKIIEGQSYLYKLQQNAE